MWKSLPAIVIFLLATHCIFAAINVKIMFFG